MIILIPMAGVGQRFRDAGYDQPKPLIPTTDRRTGEKVPMVIAATQDLPEIADSRIIYIDRNFEQRDELQQAINQHYPEAEFITLDHMTKGQASTCLCARDRINNEESLLIAACDNGMVYDVNIFSQLQQETDVLVFSFRNDDRVVDHANAYGWLRVGDDAKTVTAVSVKIPIGETPQKDHAIVGAFWFKKGSDFVLAADAMIEVDDRVNGEYYVDQAITHALEKGLRVQVFEIQRYLCWGSPEDHQAYESTINYWREFISEDPSL